MLLKFAAVLIRTLFVIASCRREPCTGVVNTRPQTCISSNRDMDRNPCPGGGLRCSETLEGFKGSILHTSNRSAPLAECGRGPPAGKSRAKLLRGSPAVMLGRSRRCSEGSFARKWSASSNYAVHCVGSVGAPESAFSGSQWPQNLSQSKSTRNDSCDSTRCHGVAS